MARTPAPLAFALLVLTGATLSAQQPPPDLSGTWTLDAGGSSAVGGRGACTGNATGGQGGGLGRGPAPTLLKITQTPASLVIEETRGDTTSRMTYTFGRSPESSNVLPAGRSAGQKITTISRWQDGTL